jgi:hypothetical protein
MRRNPLFLLVPALLAAPPVPAGETESFTPRGLAGETLIAPGQFDLETASVPRRSEIDLAGVFAGQDLAWGAGRLSLPVTHEIWQVDSQRLFSVHALSIQWQHSLGPANRVTLSTRYGDRSSSETERSVATGTAAALAWSSGLNSVSSVTGRLYLGDEAARDRSLGYAGRRYVGLELEGRYSLWRDHAPFASLAWQSSNYQLQDNNVPAGGSLTRTEQVSRFAAGWSWQIDPNWDLRAEANYRLTEDSLDTLDGDRTRFYFSTRYGFR